MIANLDEFNSETRPNNLERKKRPCLHCNRLFITTRLTRICGRCHKVVDKQVP